VQKICKPKRAGLRPIGGAIENENAGLCGLR
jgi:hypothetical protein